MSDSNVLQSEEMTDRDKTEREIFLRFHYPDTKDAFKQLFTLITAVFIFSATFGQKTEPTTNINWYWKFYYLSPYIIFIVSLAICSVGYYILSISGDKATNLNLWMFWIRSFNKKDYTDCMLHASTALEVSGGLFLLGLLLLALVAIL